MHAKALEIAWHDDSPIWSVDISCDNRVVTASGDKVARLWKFHPRPHSALSSFASASADTNLTADTGHQGLTPRQTPKSPATPTPSKQSSKLSTLSSIKLDATLVEWLCDLRAHATTINIARFSPDGLAVATASDHGEIVIWRLNTAPVEISPLAAAAHNDDAPKERWQVDVTLRGHLQDVLDLAWSSNSSKLVSASVDNSVMIWDLLNPTKAPITLRNHSNFVQGVAIDPLSRLVASMGNDRTLRVFTASSSTWSQIASVNSLGPDSRLFLDDSQFNSFFRRLSWSPDGSVLACPSGIHLPKEPKKRLYAVHIFARGRWNAPVLQCGGLVTPACAVRFSPVLYHLRNPLKSSPPPGSPTTVAAKSSHTPFRSFTYRMVFAVACAHIILFYDTEHLTHPFASVEGLHCAEHTDITWSADGRTLLVSAVDGYISVISFSDEELGKPLTQVELPPWLNNNEELVVKLHSAQKCQKTSSIVAPAIAVRSTPGNMPIQEVTPQTRVATGTPTKVGLSLGSIDVQTGCTISDLPKSSLHSGSVEVNSDPKACSKTDSQTWNTGLAEKSIQLAEHPTDPDLASSVEVNKHQNMVSTRDSRELKKDINIALQPGSESSKKEIISTAREEATDTWQARKENSESPIAPVPSPGSTELKTSAIIECKDANNDPMEVDGPASPPDSDDVIFVCEKSRTKQPRPETQYGNVCAPSPAKKQKLTPGSASRRRGKSKVQTKFCFLPAPNNAAQVVALAVAPDVSTKRSNSSNHSSQDEVENIKTELNTHPSPTSNSTSSVVDVTHRAVT